MKTYNLEINTGYDIKRDIKVYDYRGSSDFIVIEANKVNPTSFLSDICNKLKPDKNSKVFLDLTCIYGFNKKNLYEWDFNNESCKNNKFISIDKIDWHSNKYRKFGGVLATYLEEKIKRLQE